MVTPAELDALADRVAARLREPMISSVLPQEIGELFRETAKYGQWRHMYVIPLSNGYGIRVDGTINVDGSWYLRMENINGQLFWQGTFRAP